MKKFLSISLLLASVLSARAELSVEWIDGNTIRVSGDGYTVVTNVVYTNSLGTCTNCVQISPDQMHDYKTSILSECDSADSDLDGIKYAASEIYSRMDQMDQDISTFRRFGNSPVGGVTYGSPDYLSFSNYVYTTSNSQTALDLSYIPSNFGSSSTTRNSASARWVGYNNGIYDYANTYVLPEVTTTKQRAWEIVFQADSAKSHVDTIRTTVRGMSEAACSCQGDGAGSCPSPDDPNGGGDSGDCPCADQLDAIKDYVEHIDDDFHIQLQNMAYVTNFIPRMDSYAKLVSGILYNDATIVVDDGENSWSNVYRRGYSDLYDYDKSNILQRIELLLFGVTSNTGSDWTDSDISDTSSIIDDAADDISNLSDSVLQAKTDLESNITSIRDKLNQLWRNLNFFGAGALADFDLVQQFTVFEMYDVSVASKHVQDLDNVRNISRTACQIIYWTVAIIVLLLFYLKAVSLTFAWLGGFLKFFNGILS